MGTIASMVVASSSSPMENTLLNGKEARKSEVNSSLMMVWSTLKRTGTTAMATIIFCTRKVMVISSSPSKSSEGNHFGWLIIYELINEVINY